MANTNSPYRRVGSNSWKELLDQVNEELENPPSGCDPIEPIEVPEKPHRWAKSDIREVHERLNQMPGDCFEFKDIPDLWKVSIIEDIEDQLANAWCECEQCLYPCDNAAETEEQALFSVSTGAGDCTTCATTSEANDACNDIREFDYQPALTEYFDQKDIFRLAFVEACDLEEEVKELEEQVEALEEAKNEACSQEGNEAQCQELTEQLQEKEEELEEKEEELEEKETERDDARSAMIAAGQQAMVAAQSAIDNCGGTLVLSSVTSGPVPSNVKCGSEEGEMGPDCFTRDPLRCTVRWGLQQRFTYYIGTCGGGIGPFGGNWVTINTGEYDIEGNPVPTSWGPSSGCQRSVHSSTCYSTSCGPKCAGDSCPACNCGAQATMDYRLLIDYPYEGEPINCDGLPCGEDEPPEDGGEGDGGNGGGEEEEG